MLTTIAILSASFVAAGQEADPNIEFVLRVEASKLLTTRGKELPRIERDTEGNIIMLRLDRMKLSPADFAATGRLAKLRRLSLAFTNTADNDLKQLRGLSQLEFMSLTGTEISDNAVDELVQLPSLKTLCLGDVNVAPAAVARLQAHFKNQNKRFSLGYSQRK